MYRFLLHSNCFGTLIFCISQTTAQRRQTPNHHKSRSLAKPTYVRRGDIQLTRGWGYAFASMGDAWWLVHTRHLLFVPDATKRARDWRKRKWIRAPLGLVASFGRMLRFGFFCDPHHMCVLCVLCIRLSHFMRCVIRWAMRCLMVSF